MNHPLWLKYRIKLFVGRRYTYVFYGYAIGPDVCNRSQWLVPGTWSADDE